MLVENGDHVLGGKTTEKEKNNEKTKICTTYGWLLLKRITKQTECRSDPRRADVRIDFINTEII